MALRDRLLGDPRHLGAGGIRRALGLGSPTLRIRAARELAQRGRTDALIEVLGDPVPGVRRSAARGLGWAADRGHRALLDSAARTERCDTVHTALCAARIRCGAAPDEVVEEVRRRAAAELWTSGGPRSPGAVTESGPTEAERALWTELGGAPPRSRQEVLRRLHALASRDEGDPERRDGLASLAAQAPPDLLVALSHGPAGGGRRGGHATVEALGWLGDPGAAGMLTDLLRSTTSDPGRGFAERRLAAAALGRLGDPAARRAVEAALEREALEFEGRPGAGLGIQFPVRNVLLWALGELGDPAAASTLARYLDNTHGSPTGGFHLPAMAALVKLGDAAVPVLRPLLAGPEVLAANAAGVLRALGDREGLERARRDQRALVRRAAGA